MTTAVQVGLDDAMVGRLPAVCVMSGERANGYAPMVVPKPLGFAWLLLLLGPFGVLLLVGLYPRLRVRYVPGPVGVQSRNFSHARVHGLGWRPKVSLRDGLGRTYRWIEQQVRERRAVAVAP